MNLDKREMNAATRILAAAEVLAARFKIAVPGDLRSVSGGPIERSVKRSEAFAQLLENIFLESVSPGLSREIQSYTNVAMLRGASEADLKEVVGITNKATVKKLHAALKAQGSVEAVLGSDEAPALPDIIKELSEKEPGETDGQEHSHAARHGRERQRLR